jgi:hypothetical protein
MRELLSSDPDYHEARWVLNLAHMALGEYPQGVPEAFRYPPERFAPEAEMPRFLDVAAKVGLARYSRAGSAVVDDLNGDGLLDVLTCSFDTGTPLQLSLNQGDGTFRDATAEAGLGHQLGGNNLVHGDVDGDGRLDVLVLRGGRLGDVGEFPCSLLSQVEPGRFEDVTAAAGLDVEAPSRTAAFADIDLDGDLDLFIGYEALREGTGFEPADSGAPVRYPSRLYLNDGNGHFEDVSAGAGLALDGWCTGAAFGDVDGDGDADLYLSHYSQPNKLFRNEGDRTFVDVTAAAGGVGRPLESTGALFFDHDGDGDLDLFVSYSGRDIVAEREVAHWYWDGTIETDTSRLFVNDGRGRFLDVTEERGLRRVAHVNAAATADIDNDGSPDLYLATGGIGMGALWPNYLLVNDGGRRFLDATGAAGLGHLQKGQGVAFGDLDCDGDEDLFIQVGGYHLDDGFGDVLFQNPGSPHRWLAIELEGVRSNRFGVGARIRVRVQQGELERDVYAHVGARGAQGGSSLRRILGLGQADRVVELAVRWPGSDEDQTLGPQPLDAHLRVREGASRAKLVERPAFRLGGE